MIRITIKHVNTRVKKSRVNKINKFYITKLRNSNSLNVELIEETECENVKFWGRILPVVWMLGSKPHSSTSLYGFYAHLAMAVRT